MLTNCINVAQNSIFLKKQLLNEVDILQSVSELRPHTLMQSFLQLGISIAVVVKTIKKFQGTPSLKITLLHFTCAWWLNYFPTQDWEDLVGFKESLLSTTSVQSKTLSPSSKGFFFYWGSSRRNFAERSVIFHGNKYTIKNLYCLKR